MYIEARQATIRLILVGRKGVRYVGSSIGFRRGLEQAIEAILRS